MRKATKPRDDAASRDDLFDEIDRLIDEIRASLADAKPLDRKDGNHDDAE